MYRQISGGGGLRGIEIGVHRTDAKNSNGHNLTESRAAGESPPDFVAAVTAKGIFLHLAGEVRTFVIWKPRRFGSELISMSRVFLTLNLSPFAMFALNPKPYLFPLNPRP